MSVVTISDDETLSHMRQSLVMVPLVRFSILALSAICAGAVVAAGPTWELLEYASSVDGTKPLKADAAFVADGRAKPLVVVMHGYGGNRKNVSLDLRDLAPRGVFALAPDMRGSGDSAGKWDSGGLDVHDILDAVLAAVKRWPREIDARNLNIIGYSGGGGNAIACMVRFPDLFRNYVSFFGISDYGGWHRSKGRPDCNRRMEATLGGGPDDLPDVFAARDAIPAAGNARGGKLHFFWDEEERACPPAMVETFIARYREAGLSNVAVHVSRKSDTVRWKHAYRSSNRDLTKADDLYLPDVLATKGASPKLPAAGRLVVCGYVVTRKFQVWIEDGQRGQVTVEYDCRGKQPIVRVVENPRSFKVRIETRSPLAALP
ncbi:MAG: alpha/beta fold hydrolase [Verrucomicrobia bacterium]|nr:alpha/beta fold hydrolase [Verrucomicrobiota bacterium]